MSKKHIQIIVQPVDNGYTIQANSHDHPSGQNRKNASLIATNSAEVAHAIDGFVQEAFVPVEAGPETPAV